MILRPFRAEDELLRVHFPVQGELDELEVVQAALQQPADGLNPVPRPISILEMGENRSI